MFLLFLLIAAAVAIPVLFLVLGGEDEGTAVSTSTTGAEGTSTSTGSATTGAGETSTTGGSATTGAGATTTTHGSGTAATTTTSTTTTSTTTTSTTTTTLPPLQLDYLLDATYAQAVPLQHGSFLPDPWSYHMQAGGAPGSEVDVSYLGGGCVGFANQPPDVDIRWTGGGSLLCVYFVPDDGVSDTTLIVNTQLNEWACDDDSAGRPNPVVRINNPVDGTYDIWVGSYEPGLNPAGTLYITETQAICP